MEITTAKKRFQQSIRARRTRLHLRAHAGALPRLSIFRSGKHMYAQIIDDRAHKTLVSAHDLAGKTKSKITKAKRESPLASAMRIGEAIAKKAVEKKIKAVIFDRGGYKYHGRVKALAEAARKAGLQF